MGKRGPAKGHGGRPRTTNPKPRDDGYRRISVGAKSNGKQVYEHRAVMESLVGPLLPREVVHHLNEDQTDNRPDNLVLLPDRAYHRWIHATT